MIAAILTRLRDGVRVTEEEREALDVVIALIAREPRSRSPWRSSAVLPKGGAK